MSRRCFAQCGGWKSALGQQLFEKSRAGYLPTTLAQTLAEQAERAEQALEAARIGVEQGGEVISGTVRLTCTDSVLQGLLLPALAQFMPNYPALTLELSTSNDFANLSRRDADIALRLTRTPPEHLVGRQLAEISYRVCASAAYLKSVDATRSGGADLDRPGRLPAGSPDRRLAPPAVARRDTGLSLQQHAVGDGIGARRTRCGGVAGLSDQ